jgi:DNA-binding transcriptional LysR family regulator
MDLRQIRTFVTVAELGTVAKASGQLHTAQPALSRQIAQLEDWFGLQLFDRVGRRLLLTSPGEQLLVQCRGLLNHASAVRDHAEHMRRGDAGVLRVLTSPHLIEGIFPEFLHRYAARYPNVQVRLADAAAGLDAFAALERGEVHLVQTLARAVTADHERFAVHPLAPMQMLAACAPALRLGTGARVDIAALAAFPLLQASQDFLMRRNFDAVCRLAGFTPNNVLESRSPHALLAMAEAGHGVAIVPSALRMEHYKLRVLGIAYKGKPLDEPLAIVSDKRRPLPVYAKAFCEMLARHVKVGFPVKRGSPAANAPRPKGTRVPTA